MSGDVLYRGRDRVSAGLAVVADRLREEGMPAPNWSGRLIRPLVGWAGAGAPAPGRSQAAFWYALASVQLAHEASLVHDDVVDGAASRRGHPTLAARKGVGAALIEGDHLLTAAYRVASWTGSGAWMTVFARAVERTVAGEKAQAAGAGAPLAMSEYERVILGKSGELLGAALAAGPALRGEVGLERWVEAGRRLGLVYQMLDDLLDYCPHVDTGKPALGDYRRGLWTWPLEELDLPAGLDDAEIAARLRAPGADGALPLRRCVERLGAVAAEVRREVELLLPDDTVVPALLEEWTGTAESAAAVLELPDTTGWRDLMAEHARSFRFASRLFPASDRQHVMEVYAWCRYTDDLVDRSDLSLRVRSARLDTWLEVSRRAYDGERTGHPLADEVMARMKEAGVPFGYAEELVAGMRMDLAETRYGTLTELYRYTYRVASVVGLWMTEMFGIRDPWMLDRAAALGHAMQLTNILRDVGEDLRAGRIYLPSSWLAARGLDRAALDRMMAQGSVTPAYADLIESLLQAAEREYDHALPAIRRLPSFYRRPVAVAAAVYRGIHDEIRAAGYDNLSHRAHTSMAAKLRLGGQALWDGRAAAADGSGQHVTLGSKPVKGSASRTAVGRTALMVAALLGMPTLLPGTAAVAAQAGSATGVVGSSADLGVERTREVLLGVFGPERALDPVRALWVSGVESEAAVEAGLDAAADLRDRLPGSASSEVLLLRAYEGAFLALRAKHGSWPPGRLRNLREGFALMDAAVQEAPAAPELRYIRLMSGFGLPGIFGRRDAVAADLAALEELLPGSAARLRTLLEDGH